MTSSDVNSTRAPAHSAVSFDQQVDVETPEQVVLSYTLAGVGARAAAAIVDFLVVSLIIAAFIFSLSLLAKLGAPGPKPTPEESSTWAVAIFILGLVLNGGQGLSQIAQALGLTGVDFTCPGT